MSAHSQIPVSKLAWLVLLILIGAPLAFFYLATPKARDETPAVPREKRPLTKLESVGLRDYRDWDGLPELFAVWADKAHWKNDRTRFSYWNPGTRSYSYFFEARRTPDGFRFREIPEPRDRGFEWDSEAGDDSPLRLYLPVRARPEEPVKSLEKSVAPARESQKIPVQVEKPDLSPATKTGWKNENIGDAVKKP
ncbi:MAG: hypothetical protein HYV96_06160 [Opitutae bacterium]|nr:hypothetical protein [Opitutae bacterium]